MVTIIPAKTQKSKQTCLGTDMDLVYIVHLHPDDCKLLPADFKIVIAYNGFNHYAPCCKYYFYIILSTLCLDITYIHI